MSALEKRIKTPPEILIPYRDVIDHGMVLLENPWGSPKGYLHVVDVPEDSQAISYLEHSSYRTTATYTSDGKQWFVYSKLYPASVAAWVDYWD